jgi:hypothetical protein
MQKTKQEETAMKAISRILIANVLRNAEYGG